MSRGRKKSTRRRLRAVYYVFLTAGIMALGYAGYAVLVRYWYQDDETFKFETFSAPAAGPRGIQAAPIADGGTIGEISVPRLGLKSIVVQGDSEKLLRLAVGHIPETALPGEAGNVALAGHRDGLFRPLRDVERGDPIILRTPDREFQYEVEWTAVVPPTAVTVIQPTNEPALTLVTCFPFHYIGAAPERFVVRAREIAVASRVLTAPPVSRDPPEDLEVKHGTILHDHLQGLFAQGTRTIVQQGMKESSSLKAWLAGFTSRTYGNITALANGLAHRAWAAVARNGQCSHPADNRSLAKVAPCSKSRVAAIKSFLFRAPASLERFLVGPGDGHQHSH
jgi:sortase A